MTKQEIQNYLQNETNDIKKFYLNWMKDVCKTITRETLTPLKDNYIDTLLRVYFTQVKEGGN